MEENSPFSKLSGNVLKVLGKASLQPRKVLGWMNTLFSFYGLAFNNLRYKLQF